MAYRRDPLKNAEALKEAQVKVLQYFKPGTEKKLTDSTPSKIWLSEKAKLMGLTLKEENLKNLPDAPKDFVFDLSNLSLFDGWSKNLEEIPSFSIEYIDSYSQKISTAVLSKSKKVMKHFCRGEELLEDDFIDIASIYLKQSDTLICLKGVCTASLKKQNCWTFMALSKVDGLVSYAYCQCPTGKVVTCLHMFAVMTLVAKWGIDKLTKIPETKACTSKSCTWSVPQSRRKLFKSPISEISLISPSSKKNH